MRTLRWIIVVVAAVVAGPGTLAGPAYADGRADLSVRISGTAVTRSPKATTITVTNLGPDTARGVHLRITGKVDSESVDPGFSFCRPRPASATSPTGVATTSPASTAPPTTTTATPSTSSAPSSTGEDDPHREVDIGEECDLPDLAPGHSHRLDATIQVWVSGSGQFGWITAEVFHGGIDPRPGNNAITANLILAAYGPDLYARVWDVPVDDAGRTGVVPPGGTTDLRWEIGNAGWVAVRGIRVTIRLPDHVTFANRQPGCGYDTGLRTATCVYRDLTLIARRDDADPEDGSHSAVRFRHRLAVSADAPASAHLPGGTVHVEPASPTAGATASPTAGGRATTLPAGATGATALADVDPSDNTDRFTVFTGPAPGGLPVTGVPGPLLAGLGLGGLVAGAALLLLARRRRVVVAVPPDERSG